MPDVTEMLPIIDEAYREGKREGNEAGYREGYRTGYEDGYQNGVDDALAPAPRRRWWPGPTWLAWVAFVVLLLLLAFGVLVAAAPPAAGAATFEDRVTARINDHRDRDVSYDSCADWYAERWARHLASTRSFYHRSQQLVLEGCHARLVGEVIAYGYDTPRGTVRAWMRSPGHRAVITDERYRRIGVGALYVDGGWLVVVNMIRR